MYVFLDLIWLLNFCLDFLLLWLTAIFRRLDFTWWRLLIASGIGSSYVLFLFIPPLQSLYTLVIKLLLALVIIAVAFGYGHFQKFMSTFCTFYFVSFVTGGGVFGLHFFLQSQHALVNGMVVTQGWGYGDPVSWLFVLVGFIGMFLFSRSRWKQIERAKRTEHFLVEGQIFFGQQIVWFRGLVDTGNQLSDPVSRMPVMMLESTRLSGVLPDTLLKQLASGMNGTGGELESLQEFPEWAKRIRIIPYRGVQQGMQLMLALKPDQVVVIQEGRQFVSQRCLIGLNEQPLSREGTFQAIVHPELLQTELIKEAVVSC